MTGKLMLVQTVDVGSILSQDASAADTVLYVDDYSDFSDSGELKIGTEIIEYDTTFDDDADSVYLSLATALGSGYVTGDFVYVYPTAKKRFGNVISAEGEITAEIDSRIWAYLEDGARDDSTAESVVVENSAVVAIIGQTPKIITDRHRARAYKTTYQSISHLTDTKVDWEAESYDTDSNFDLTGNRYNCPVAGYYQVSVAVSFASNPTGDRGVMIYKNGTVYAMGSFVAASSSRGTTVTVSTDVSADVGDYIEIYVWQNSGVALNIDSGSEQTYIAVHRF